MKQIQDYIDNFIAPEPIFSLKLRDSGESVRVSHDRDLELMYSKMKHDENFQLLKPLFSPSWDFSKSRGIFLPDKDHTFSNFKRTLKESLINEIQTHIRPTKQARRQLYDWLISNENEDIENTFLELHLYLKKQEAVQSPIKDHVMNVYLILQAMKEKYGKQKR